MNEIIRFIFVGGLNTVFAYSLYATFIYLGLDYQLAVLISTCLGVMFNYKTTGKLVFKHADKNVFIKFAGVYAFLYFINITLIKWLHSMSDNFYLAGFLTIIPLAAMAFILNKYLVFRKPTGR